MVDFFVDEKVYFGWIRFFIGWVVEMKLVFCWVVCGFVEWVFLWFLNGENVVVVNFGVVKECSYYGVF